VFSVALEKAITPLFKAEKVKDEQLGGLSVVPPLPLFKEPKLIK
jgi:hypothetical protein